MLDLIGLCKSNYPGDNHSIANELLCTGGRRDWPLCFYDPKTLFSREARLGWVEPDLAPLPLERC